jgi:hypothetical protein
MNKAGMLMAMAAALGAPALRYDHEVGHSFPVGARPSRRMKWRKRGTTKSVETKTEARDRKKLERQRKRDARRQR